MVDPPVPFAVNATSTLFIRTAANSGTVGGSGGFSVFAVARPDHELQPREVWVLAQKYYVVPCVRPVIVVDRSDLMYFWEGVVLVAYPVCIEAIASRQSNPSGNVAY